MENFDIDNVEIPDTDMTTYSLDEMRQLRTLFTQSLDHYNGLLKDKKLMGSLKEGDLMALQLCLKETEEQIKEIDELIESRLKEEKK